MGEMDGFTEASAVHLRVEYYKEEGEEGEESLEGKGSDACRLPPYTCYKSRSYEGFCQCECDSKRFGGKAKELKMEKVHIFRHDQSGTYRIHKFQNASYEEDETGYKAAEAFEA